MSEASMQQGNEGMNHIAPGGAGSPASPASTHGATVRGNAAYPGERDASSGIARNVASGNNATSTGARNATSGNATAGHGAKVYAAADTTPGQDPSGADKVGGAPEGAEWYAGIGDENIRRWAQAKGWKDPLAAVESNYNLERLFGLDRVGRTVTLPRQGASAQELREFHSRLGVPETADGYNLPVPADAPPDFARTAAQWMHEAGVPAKSAGQLAARWNAHLAAAQQAAQQQHRVESAVQVEQLKAEWGSTFDANAEHARRAALHFMPGADEAGRRKMMDAAERGMGAGNFLRFMSRVGRGLSEHMLVSSGDAGSGGVYSASEARARIAQLRADRAWTASYVAGDAAKAAEMNRLHRMAFPGEAE